MIKYKVNCDSRVLMFLIVNLITSLIQNPCFSQNSNRAPSTADYMSDNRLNFRMTLRASGIPLKELLEKCSSSNIKLTIDDKYIEQKVQINVKNQDLKTIMKSISELFLGDWKADAAKKSYVFSLTNVAWQKRERWWRLYTAEREKSIVNIKRNMLEEIVSPYSGKPDTDSETDKRAANEAKTRRGFFKVLPREMMETISDRINLDTIFRGNYHRFDDDEGAFYILLEDLPDSVKEKCKIDCANNPEWSNLLTSQNAGKIGVEFQFYGSGIMANMVFPGTNQLRSLTLDSFGGPDPSYYLLTPFHDGLFKYLKAFPRYSSPTRALLAQLNEERIWPNTLPNLRDLKVLGNIIRPVRWQKLDWMAKMGDLEFLSDYHSTFGYKLSDSEQKAPLKRTVDEELNELAILHDLSWKKGTGNLYLVKNNRWYRDDYMEVPTSYLNKLAKAELPNTIVTADDAYSKPESQVKSGLVAKATLKSSITTNKMRLWLDRASDIASQLSPWQIGKGLKYYVPEKIEELSDSLKMLQQRNANAEPLIAESTPRYRNNEGLFGQDAQYILDRYRTILFYSTLKKEARTKLLGEGLPFDELNADQRDRAIWLLPQIGIMMKQGDESPKVLILRPLRDSDSYIPGKLYLKETMSGN